MHGANRDSVSDADGNAGEVHRCLPSSESKILLYVRQSSAGCLGHCDILFHLQSTKVSIPLLRRM